MQNAVNTYNFLKLIPFIQFDLWDTKRYTSKALTSTYNIVELGSCIQEENKKYKLFEDEETEFGILGVNNKEGIFDAYLQKGKEINQAYKKMQVGWLAYNPYRINVGSIGIRLKEHKKEYISPAYVVFSCKENLLPEYLFLIFKTQTFNKVINESTTGSVRQNLTIDILKKLKIPLPSLAEQEKIINDYQSKIAQAQALQAQANNLETEIEKYLFHELAVEIDIERKKVKGLQFVQYSEIEFWGTDKLLHYAQKENAKHKLLSFNEKPELVNEVYRGKSPVYDTNSTEIVLNQKCNRWNAIDLEHSKKVDKQWLNKIDEMYFTKEGDILINSTGEGTIGRASYITKEFEGLMYDSHLLMLRLNKKVINPEFYVEFFNSRIAQKQIDNLKSAQSTNQTELGVINLKKIIFPLPDLKKQNEILQAIKEKKSQIQQLTTNHSKLLLEAEQEFEKQIFYYE